MEDARDLVIRLASEDSEEGLRAVAALRAMLERIERVQVEHAREQGLSWQDIAEQLGVSKQAVHQKYAKKRRRW
jgi:DNA-directed RNA polymerase specialized sigma24 family protein